MAELVRGEVEGTDSMAVVGTVEHKATLSAREGADEPER